MTTAPVPLLSTATSLAVGLLVAVTFTVGAVPKAPVTATPMALVETVLGVTGGSEAAADDPVADELAGTDDDADADGDAVALFFEELQATRDVLASTTATPASRLRRVSS